MTKREAREITHLENRLLEVFYLGRPMCDHCGRENKIGRETCRYGRRDPARVRSGG